MSENGKWHAVADINELDDDEAQCVHAADCQIALCRVDGKFYAIDDICSHEYASMSDGFIDGENIECPLHQASFHIPTGKVLSPPADEDLKTYPTKVEDGKVYVLVEE